MYQLQRSSLSDLEKIAKCQQQCFTNSFSVKLGEAYIVKSLEWFLPGENRFLYHIITDDIIAGYCGGFISQQYGDGSTSGIMQYAMREAMIGMIKKPWLFFSKEILPFYPLIFKSIFRKIIPVKHNPQKKPLGNQLFEKKTGLVVIAVLPVFQGKGIFEMLMTEFENETRRRNLHKMILSVKKDNQRAISAYKRVGWQIANQHAQSLEMFKIIK